MKTAITELFDIEHPIIQGGMHYVGFAELAGAVSNAGGFGIITGLTQRTGFDGSGSGKDGPGRTDDRSQGGGACVHRQTQARIQRALGPLRILSTEPAFPG
jgi:NAD(P)H-dependent flavin oxidoreductase YrpB (nitropropane dioxygenase family)